MNILLEWLLEALAGIGGPSTARGLVRLSTLAGLTLSILSGWIFASSFDVRTAPAWVVSSLVISLLMGVAGVFLASLHLAREPRERVLGAVCLTANAAAVALPLSVFGAS